MSHHGIFNNIELDYAVAVMVFFMVSLRILSSLAHIFSQVCAAVLMALHPRRWCVCLAMDYFRRRW